MAAAMQEPSPLKAAEMIHAAVKPWDDKRKGMYLGLRAKIEADYGNDPVSLRSKEMELVKLMLADFAVPESAAPRDLLSPAPDMPDLQFARSQGLESWTEFWTRHSGFDGLRLNAIREGDNTSLLPVRVDGKVYPSIDHATARIFSQLRFRHLPKSAQDYLIENDLAVRAVKHRSDVKKAQLRRYTMLESMPITAAQFAFLSMDEAEQALLAVASEIDGANEKREVTKAQKRAVPKDAPEKTPQEAPVPGRRRLFRASART